MKTCVPRRSPPAALLLGLAVGHWACHGGAADPGSDTGTGTGTHGSGDGDTRTASSTLGGHEGDSGGDTDSGDGGVTDGGDTDDSGTTGPAFDASALDVDGTAGPGLCRLSEDGRHLLVRVKNAGSTQTFATTVRIATDGTTYETRLETPALGAGESGELMVDRGPLVGFVETWQFTVTVDPDGEHGAAHTPIQGECQDLRTRARLAMAPLAAWYHQDSGLWGANDWWTSANQLETVIDYSRETGDPAYFEQIDNTFEKNKADDFDKWGYYDDDGWFAIAWIKAYDLTHQQKYLDMAEAIFARMAGGWSDVCGGGIYWASAKAGDNGLKNKNAIPNSLFLQVAAKLHNRIPGDTAYREWAEQEWQWFKNTGMIDGDHLVVDGLDNLTDCTAEGPIFTYNQGVLVGGLVDLAAATGDASYLDEATAIARATMEHMADDNGILAEPGCGGDICVQFKGVFMRNLALLYQARPSPDLLVYMRRQSDRLFAADHNDQGQYCYEWHLGCVDGEVPTPGRQSSALDGLIAAVSSSNLNLALHAAVTGSAPCSAAEVARNAIDGSSRAGSKWCAGGAGDQSLELDLGAPRSVVGFVVRHAGAGGEQHDWNTRDFEIQTSIDGQRWTDAVTVTGNTDDVTDHPVPTISARHVRLHITTPQTANEFVAARIYELEVLGIGLD